MIPLVLILPRFLGVEGVLWAGCISDVLACLLCLALYKRYWKQIFAEPAAGSAQPLPADRGGAGFLGDGQTAAKDAPKVIITIGRSYGSNGAAIGRAVADRLHIPYYDGEIMQKAAENSGLSMRYLAHMDENTGGYRLIYNITALPDVSAGAMDTLQRMADEAQSEIILQAAQGPCVIIGRRADQVLQGRDNVVRVFITATLADRVKTVGEEQRLSPADAERKVQDIDRRRAEYYAALDGRVWGQADNYDVCLNVSAINREGAIYMIESAVKGKLEQLKHAAG